VIQEVFLSIFAAEKFNYCCLKRAGINGKQNTHKSEAEVTRREAGRMREEA
jgi:hypothetical protein